MTATQSTCHRHAEALAHEKGEEYGEDEDKAEEEDQGERSVVLALLSQLRFGMDLTKVRCLFPH